MEVCFNDRWGTICHDDWDVADALIVCRILGYDKQNIAIPTLFNYFNGNLDVPVLLSEVQCNGTETRFLDCLSVNPGDHDCSHFRDAGVFCSGGSIYHKGLENHLMISGVLPQEEERTNHCIWRGSIDMGSSDPG